MNLREHIFGTTIYGNKLLSFISDFETAHKYLYFIAGIHGNEMEGIYILNQLKEWIHEHLFIETPLVIIPIFNIDGYLNSSRVNANIVDLNYAFPSAPGRNIGAHSYLRNISRTGLEAECLALQKMMDDYPPEMLIHFITTQAGSPSGVSSQDGKIIVQGETSKSVGAFLARYNHYPLLISDNTKNMILGGSLESFVYDLYLTSTLSVHVPPVSQTKTFQMIWQDHALGVKLLLSGQMF